MSPELLVVGIVVACLFVEVAGFYPGGIVVPAYIALHLDQPLRLVGTLIVAAVAWGIYVMLSRWFILFGRRRFVMLILLGVTIAAVGSRLLPALWPATVELRAVGWVVPGLLANSFERQGVVLTIVGMAIASLVTYFLVHLILG